jgi:hypothetical protein
VPRSKYLLFRVRWWMGSLGDRGGWAYPLRQYLKGFPRAVAPAAAAAEQPLETILGWMNSGPAHPVAAHPAERPARAPETTDFRLGIPRFPLCEYLRRANAAFFSTPGIK